MATLDQTLFRFIWRYSRRDQVLVLGTVLLSLPFYFFALDLPKTIVNKAIQGEGFEEGQPQTAFEIALPAWEAVWGGRVVLFGGIELERLPFLVAMSLLFLALVIVNGLFKLQINTAKGRMGERMLRRLRFMLFERILNFPPEHLKTVKAPELVTMIKDEVEPLGGFIGDAYVQPVFLGGQVLTALAFIFLQNFWLGAVAGGIALIQALLVPRLRTPLLALGRERQLTARALAGRIGDSIDGIEDIHVNGTADYERAAIGASLGHIFSIRFLLYRKKFFVKFINNLLAQITPFLFFLVGGYFAIQGRLDVGQLVAVIVAYKELPGPMKELIDWDLRRLDGGIKYDQVVSQFAPGPPATTADDGPFDGSGAMLEIVDLVVGEEDGPLRDPLSLTVPPTGKILLSGAEAGPVLETLARLRTPASGAIHFAGRSLAEMPSTHAERCLSYVGEAVQTGGGTVFDTLAYGLLHAPPDPVASEETEAHRTGNPIYSIEGDWIDYARAGVRDRAALKGAMIDVLQVVEMESDLYSWGLRSPVDANIDGDDLMRARHLVAIRLESDGAAGLVERFDGAAYNGNLTIAENIVFGASSSTALTPEQLADDSYFREVLEGSGLNDDLMVMGRKIGETMVEIFSGLSPESSLVEQFSFVSGEELPALEEALKRRVPGDADRSRLLALALRYCEVRHRLDLLPPGLERNILAARGRFRSALPDRLRDGFASYDADRPTLGALLIDDILFGRIAETVANARERVEALLHDVLRGENLLPIVMEAGLAHPVGSKGRRLSTSQRQRLGIARALLRHPDTLVLNRALAALDLGSEARIVTRITERLYGKRLLAALGSDHSADLFDRHIVFDGMRVISDSQA